MLCFALAVLLAAPASRAPASRDTTDRVERATPRLRADDTPARVQIRPRFATSALYSQDGGFGIGGGVGVRNAVGRGSDLTVDLRLQQHRQSAVLALASSARYDAPVRVSLVAGALTTDRRRYYGVGPASRDDRRVDLSYDAAFAEVGVGVYPLGTTVLRIEPALGVRVDRSGGIQKGSGSLADFDLASRRAIDSARGSRTALTAGLEVATDLRDRPGSPRRGLLATAEHRRLFGTGASDLSLAQTSASVAGYVPLGGRATVLLRAVGAVTRSGDADGDGDGQPDAIPFYDLPTLDSDLALPFRRDRLTGRDVLAVGAGVRVPVVDAFGLYGIDATVMGFLGGAYDDVTEQFSPAVSFRTSADVASANAEGRVPLTPSLALGLGLVNLGKERLVLGALVGIGPSGFTLASVRLAYDLRRVRTQAR